MNDDILILHIDKQEYRIKLGNQDPEYIKELADYVDKKIETFTKEFPTLDYQKLLILICLNLSDEIYRGKKDKEDKVPLLKALTELKELLKK